MKPSRLSLPRSATVNILRPPSRTTWRCWRSGRQATRRRNAQRTHNDASPHAAAARRGRRGARRGRSSTYELARIARKKTDILDLTIAIKTQYYQAKYVHSPLHGARPSTLLAMCMWCDLVSVVTESKCLSVLIRALSRQSADSPARPRIAFAHDDDDDAHNSSRRKSAVLPDHCSILHPQVPSTILAPRRPLCRPNVTTLACPRRTGRRGGYIFSHRHDWMSA